MKKFVLLSICLLLVAGVSAQTLRGGQVAVENLNVARNGEALFVAMDVDLTGLQLSPAMKWCLLLHWSQRTISC